MKSRLALASLLLAAALPWTGARAIPPQDRATALIATAAAAREGPHPESAEGLLAAAAEELGPPDAANARAWAELEWQRALGSLDRLDNPRAEAQLARARAHLDAAGAAGEARYAQVLAQQAQLDIVARRFEPAARALAQADRILDAAGASATHAAATADVVRERTELAFAQGHLPEALASAERELALRRRIGGRDDPEALDPLSAIGAIRSMQGDFRGAERALREGLRLAALAPERRVDQQLTLTLNLAGMWLDRGREADALPVAQRAVDLAERRYGAQSAQLLRMLPSLASVHEALGRYAESWQVLERAAALEPLHRESLGLQRRLRLVFGQARVAWRMGDSVQAREALARTRALIGDAEDLGYWRGFASALDCRLAARDRDWPGAERQCANAADLLGRAIGPRSPVAMAPRVGQCLAQASGRLPGEACDEVRQWVAAEAVANDLVRYLALAGLAQRAETDGDLAGALRLRVRAFAVAQLLGTPDPLWTAQASLAALLQRRGDRELAVYFGKLSVASVEAMRTQFAGDTARFERGFLSDKLGAYRQLADWLFADGRFDEALAVTRLLKDEELQDFEPRRAAVAVAAAGPAWTPREAGIAQAWQRLDTRPSALAAKLEQLTRLKRLTPHEQATLRSLGRDQRRREASLAQAVEAFLAARPGVAQNRPAPVVDVPRPTGPDDLFVVLLTAEDHVNLFVSSRQGVALQRIPIGRDELGVLVGRYLEALDRRAALAPWGPRLDELFGRPLERAAATAGARRIVLVADGVLRYLPVGALRGEGGYLVERHAIEYASVGSPRAGKNAKAMALSMATPRGDHLRAFGVTRAWGELPALPGVRRELCAIVRGPVLGLDGGACPEGPRGEGAMEGSAFADEAFTQARMATALARESDFDVLHIGTHFALRPGRVDRSWLLMGDGARLSLEALGGFDFRGLKLVTLSACQTGLAGATGDDGVEVDGLPGLLEAGGAEAVLSSLWHVPDRRTGELMAAFYRHLQAGASAAEALRQAELQLMRAGATHPYDWAGFRLSSASWRF